MFFDCKFAKTEGFKQSANIFRTAVVQNTLKYTSSQKFGYIYVYIVKRVKPKMSIINTIFNTH